MLEKARTLPQSARPRASNAERADIRLVGRVVGDFGLIDEGDRILVAVSGG